MTAPIARASLRAAAQAATQHWMPRASDPLMLVGEDEDGEERPLIDCDPGDWKDAIAKDIGAYIAAASPSVTLALLSALEQAEAERDAARAEAVALLTVVHEAEAGAGLEQVTIGAYCERFGDKPIAVHPDRLEGLLRALKARADEACGWAHGALKSHKQIGGVRAERDALRARVAKLDKLASEVRSAMETSGGRWGEWGGRAEMVRDILEAALAAFDAKEK